VNQRIECLAVRRGRSWVVNAPEHGAFGHGRTLKTARNDIEKALALVGVTAEVTLVPVTPELTRLRSAREDYTTALGNAVLALADLGTSWSDIAEATEVPAKTLKELLDQRSTGPADLQAEAETPPATEADCSRDDVDNHP